MESVIIIGAGGHARVLIDMLLNSSKYYIIGITDTNIRTNRQVMGFDIIGCDDAILEYLPDQVQLINGIGFVPGFTVRSRIYNYFKKKQFNFPALLHPTAIVSGNADIREGVQIMAGAIVQAGARIGENSIINTKASIDHDCQIGPNVHVASGATLCGNVVVSNDVFIGAGATITPGVYIGSNAIIAAGAVVLEDVADNDLVMGIPARSQYNEKMVGCVGFGRC